MPLIEPRSRPDRRRLRVAAGDIPRWRPDQPPDFLLTPLRGKHAETTFFFLLILVRNTTATCFLFCKPGRELKAPRGKAQLQGSFAGGLRFACRFLQHAIYAHHTQSCSVSALQHDETSVACFGAARENGGAKFNESLSWSARCSGVDGHVDPDDGPIAESCGIERKRSRIAMRLTREKALASDTLTIASSRWRRNLVRLRIQQ